jgi:hypothetical protein
MRNIPINFFLLRALRKSKYVERVDVIAIAFFLLGQTTSADCDKKTTVLEAPWHERPLYKVDLYRSTGALREGKTTPITALVRIRNIRRENLIMEYASFHKNFINNRHSLSLWTDYCQGKKEN